MPKRCCGLRRQIKTAALGIKGDRMKREELLKKLGFTVPENKKMRVILHTDAKNEADDQYAILHFSDDTVF